MANERAGPDVVPKEVKSFWFFHRSRPAGPPGDTGPVTDLRSTPPSPWYESAPGRRGREVRRRDKVELVIAVLLLTGLLGLLAISVSQDEPAPVRAAAATV